MLLNWYKGVMTETPSMSQTAGTVIAQYRIEREIGRGAMGIVYLAIQEQLERPVALKVLNSALAHDQEFVKRFFNEARSAAALSHPKIIQAYDAGFVEPDLYFFAMEYIEGETLYDQLKREGALKQPEALAVASDIAEALHYGWKRQNLIHGNIKPENIMISAAGETKLADFGLAKVSGHDFSGDGIMLTPLYAAPELIRGDAPPGDCRPDIYSFGATLYHLLNGEPPFPGTDPKVVLRRHLEETVRPLSDLNSKISKDVSDFVCLQLLAKDPAARPQTWEQVLSSLEWFHHRRLRKMVMSAPGAAGGAAAPGGGTRSATPARNSNLLRLILAGSFLALGLLIPALWFVWNRARPHAGTTSNATAPATLTPAQKAVLADWQTLQERLDNEADAFVADDLLQAFREAHANWLPPDFDLVFRDYQKRLISKPAPATPDGKKPETPAPVTPPTPVPVLPAPVPVVPAPPPETAVKPAPKTAEAAPRREEDSPQAIARADELAQIWYGLHLQSSQTVGRVPETTLAAARDWLTRYPQASPERSQLLFLTGKILPAYEEFLPVLIKNKAKFAGLALPAPDKTLKPFRDLAFTEYQVTEKVDSGEFAVHVPWTTPGLDRKAVLGTFTKTVFTDPALTPAERAPYLAWLLLSRQFDPLEQQLPELHDAALAREWLLASRTYLQAPTEGQALALWREVEDAARQSQVTQACRAALRLRALPSAGAARHGAEIDRLLRQNQDRLPEMAAPALVQNALEKLAAAPEESLLLLGTAKTRYGRLDFPENAEIDKLRQKAVEQLAEKGTQEEHWAPIPRLSGGLPDYPGEAGVSYFLALKNLNAMTAPQQAGMTSLHPLALMELGDWGTAQKIFQETPVPKAGGVPPVFHAARLFGRALAADRFEDRTFDAAAFHQRMAEIRREPPVPDEEAKPELVKANQFPAILGQFTADYALLTRTWDQIPASAQLGQLAISRQSPAAGPLLLTLATLDLEAQQRPAALELLRKCKERLDAKTEDLPEHVAAAKALAFLEGHENRPPLPADVPRNSRARYSRFLLSAMLARTPQLTTRQEKDLVTELAGRLDAAQWAGLEGWLDALLLRVGYELSSRNDSAALALVRKALDDRSPLAGTCYPRILFLRAGLEQLTAPATVARETLAAVAHATTAAPSELALAKARSGGNQGGDADLPFWSGWLRWTAAVKASDAPGAKAALAEMRSGARSLAEKRMVSLLAEVPVSPR